MWRISCIDNSLKVNKKCAKELFEQSEQTASETWFEVKDVTDSDGVITFNSDHMEHMDLISDQANQQILKNNKAKGKVTFGSLDGDNFGEFWGYEFDGKGGMKLLKGTLSWE